MPACVARSARALPTVWAADWLPPYLSFAASCLSRVEALASVLPSRSSMIWAEMCLWLRLTQSRGRSCVPRVRLRTRNVRR